MRFQKHSFPPQHEVTKMVGSSLNKYMFDICMSKNPSISYRTGDRRIVRSIQHAHDRTRCGVPQLHIHLEGSLPLFHPFQPGRSNDNLVILRPQAIAQFHLASTLWEVYSSSAPKIGTNITVQHNRRAHREVRRTAPHTRVALGLRCCDQLIARV